MAVSFIATGRWFSPGTSVSSTNKTDRHDITEILLKEVLNIITITKPIVLTWINFIEEIFIFVHPDFYNPLSIMVYNSSHASRPGIRRCLTENVADS